MKKRWPFGKKVANTNLEIQHPPVTTPSSSIYLSIHKLPLHKFIDCIVDNNIYALRIKGNPSEIELQQAWNNILQEYTETIGDNEYRLHLSLFRSISELQLTLDQIRSLAAEEKRDPVTGDITELGILRKLYSRYLCNELNKLLKTSFRLNWADQASYQEELNKCMRRSKAIKISLDLKLLQFEAIEKKHEDKKGHTYTRPYFISVLINLSNHAKYQIPDTITVLEYCERMKQYNQYAETLKNQKHGR